MDWGSPLFVVSIIALSSACWLANNWIRARHGYPLQDDSGRNSLPASNAENLRLKQENRELNEKLDSMQDRMIVLEKIVTDRGYTLADEIEALREKGNTRNSQPLDKEKA